MSLQINRLKIEVATSEGLFGVDIPFQRGLFVLHADNTSGKSICLNSILYALGLEGMLSPSRDIPLKPAVTNILEWDTQNLDVLESYVFLEVSNNHQTITIKRPIKSQQNKDLITVWNGPILSQANNSFTSNDYFVRQSGSASRERGFHRFLADFIGWDIPSVDTYQGRNVPLYLETLFPFIFVEQQHGWINLSNRFPTYLRIKEVGRRAFEFFMNLDTQDIATRKNRLKLREKRLRDEWRIKVNECQNKVSLINAVIQDLPDSPLHQWPPTPDPKILLPKGEEWFSINQTIEDLQEHLQSLENQEMPIVENIADEIKANLSLKEEELLSLESSLKIHFENLETQRNYVIELDQRIIDLNTELTKNQDLKKLSRLGSLQNLNSISGECPTCHQSISDSLIASIDYGQIMTLDENVDFIRQQLSVFQSMREEERGNLIIQQRKINLLRTSINGIRDDIRAIKTTLTSQNNAPSYALIEEKVRLQSQITGIQKIRNEISEILNSFFSLVEEWDEIQNELKQLPSGILSDLDEQKIQSLQESFQEQLHEYDFRSLEIREVKISEDSYLPEYQGYNLAFDTSASDAIRIIWSYLFGLLEVSSSYETNHLGLLIFDEPRQQSSSEGSFLSLLNRINQSLQPNQQVIVATSERLDNLASFLSQMPADSYVCFDGKIIQPL